MTHRPSLPYARGDRRPTCNFKEAMKELGCSKRHVYNLFDREELQGFYIGNRRGLRIYLDSIEGLKRRKGDESLL